MNYFFQRFFYFLIRDKAREQILEFGRTHGARIERGLIMDYAFEFIAKSGLDGAYMEFGCFNGSSFIQAYHACKKHLKSNVPGQKLSKHKFYAFDSFEGLPALDKEDQSDGYDVFEEGQYAYSRKDFKAALKRGGVDLKDVMTIPGFYEDSLTDELKVRKKLPKIAIAHIDCDLYSSAKTVLNFLTDLVQDGSLILFDDYFCYKGRPDEGVRRAFYEWLNQTGYKATAYTNYHWAGKAFILHTQELSGTSKDFHSSILE